MMLLSGLPSLHGQTENRIICGNDPVNRHDPLGLDPLSEAQMARGQQALRGAFEYPNGQPGYLSRFATLDEFKRDARRVFQNAAGVFPEVQGQLADAYGAADSFVNKLAPAWAAQRCASEAQKAAAACAMDRRNAAHQQFFSSYPKVLGLTWSMVGAEALNVGANPLGFGVSADWEYDFSNGKSGVGLSTHEISGGKQAVAIGMLMLPWFLESKGFLAAEELITIEHGTTLERIPSLLANGPQPNLIRDLLPREVPGFSAAGLGAASPTAMDYALAKAVATKGTAAVLRMRVPKSLLERSTYNFLPTEVRWEGADLVPLLEKWGSIFKEVILPK
jgi:hypothetical protein